MENRLERSDELAMANGSEFVLKTSRHATAQPARRDRDALLAGGVIIPREGQRFDGQGESMARRRYQKGWVILRGKTNPVWVGRWREDVIGADGVTRRIERSEILGSKSEIPTQRLALRRLEVCFPGLTRRIIDQPSWRLWPNLPRGGKKRCFRNTNRAVGKRRSLICAVTSCRSLERPARCARQAQQVVHATLGMTGALPSTDLVAQLRARFYDGLGECGKKCDYAHLVPLSQVFRDNLPQ